MIQEKLSDIESIFLHPSKISQFLITKTPNTKNELKIMIQKILIIILLQNKRKAISFFFNG